MFGFFFVYLCVLCVFVLSELLADFISGELSVVRKYTLLAVLALVAFGSHLPRAAAQGDEAKKAALQDLLLKAEDEYRLFFHKPKTPFEYWAAIEFEIKTGKFDVAGLLLDQLVK